MLYVQVNSLLSCLLANREWHRYSQERKTLRVSNPVGLQRSSYFVSMPWRYGIPLMTTVACLHWTLSQSIFIVPIEQWDSDGVRHPSLDYVMLGFSVWAIITCKSTRKNKLAFLKSNAALYLSTNYADFYSNYHRTNINHGNPPLGLPQVPQ